MKQAHEFEAGYELDFHLAQTVFCKENIQKDFEGTKKWFDHHQKMGFFAYSSSSSVMMELIENRLLPQEFEVVVTEHLQNGVCEILDKGIRVAFQMGKNPMEAFGRALIELTQHVPNWINRLPFSYNSKRPSKNVELDVQIAKEVFHYTFFTIKNDEEREYHIQQFRNGLESFESNRFSSSRIAMESAIRNHVLPEDYYIIQHYGNGQSTFTLADEKTNEVYVKSEDIFMTMAFVKALIERAKQDPYAFQKRELRMRAMFKNLTKN